jgi:hypothetical protein
MHQLCEAVRICTMKRTSVTIAVDVERALEAYGRDQDIPPRLVDVVQAALREYLAGRGYLPPSSERAVRAHQVLALTSEGAAAFVDAITNPPEPNDTLRALAREAQEIPGQAKV